MTSQTKRLTTAQRKLFAELSEESGAWCECMENEYRTAKALQRRGLIEISEEWGEVKCHDDRFEARVVIPEKRVGQGRHRIGWYCVFDEKDEDMGEIPEGFFMDDERAKTFHEEPGFLRNHLVPVFIDLDAQVNDQEPQYLTADQLTEPGYYWWLPTSMADQVQLAEFWHIRAWDSRDNFRERSGLFVGPLKAPVRRKD